MRPDLLLTAALASTPASGQSVGLLRMSGPEGELLRDRLRDELEPDFAVQVFALDAAELRERLRCVDLDRSCLLALGMWFAREEATNARYAVIETDSAPARTILVCDLATGIVIRVFRARDNADDLVLPLVLPGAIARTIRDHHHPPPPPTAEEKLVLAHLDEPPLDPSELEAEACLHDEHACPHAHPPPIRGHACSVTEGTTPLALLLLLAAMPRRRRGGVP